MACDSGGCSGGCWSCEGCTGGASGTSCDDNCSSSCAVCSSGCGSGCKGCDGCGGACSDSCSGDCEGDCDGCRGCSGTCQNECTACTGSCVATCNNGCTGGEHSRVYTNLTLQTLIMADDIIDLKNLIKNEAERRGLSPLDTPEESRGIIAEFQTIDAILTNLRTSGAIPNETQSYGGVMGRSAMLEYVQLAKTLYEANLAK